MSTLGVAFYILYLRVTYVKPKGGCFFNRSSVLIHSYKPTHTYRPILADLCMNST